MVALRELATFIQVDDYNPFGLGSVWFCFVAVAISIMVQWVCVDEKETTSVCGPRTTFTPTYLPQHDHNTTQGLLMFVESGRFKTRCPFAIGLL